jgi:hypothetical protein
MARRNAKKTRTTPTTKQVVDAKTAESAKEEPTAPSSGTYGWVLKLVAAVAGLAVTYFLRQLDVDIVRAAHYISRNDVTEHLRFNVTCAPLRVRWCRLWPLGAIKC